MISTFKYIDRGAEDTIVLVPGWATDCNIFSRLKLRFNYLLPVDLSPMTFEESLLELLQELAISKVSVFGWSLGGFLASEFAVKHPQLIDRLIMVSVREQYNIQELNQIKAHLKKNTKGYLYKFYTSCFLKPENISWFKKNLLKDYCSLFELDYLLNTLDYLAAARIDTEGLKAIERVEFIHGEYDKIAPLEEALQVRKKLTQAGFRIIKDAGHLPFLKEDFNLDEYNG